MRSWIEQEIDALEDQLNRGQISLREYNHEVRELERDYRAAANEAAERAAADELERW